jgi:hypothetical protein
MPKFLISLLLATALGGAASAQTASPNAPPNQQNPEATCPPGANCAPGQAGAASRQGAPSAPVEATGSTARPSSDKIRNTPAHRAPSADDPAELTACGLKPRTCAALS